MAHERGVPDVAAWPPLPLEAWRDTYATLHMWMQIVGKVCLARTPLVNHFWNIAFHYTPRGLTTLPMRADDGTFTMAFDLTDHELRIVHSGGRAERVPLEPRTVADFYGLVMDALARLGIQVRVWSMP